MIATLFARQLGDIVGINQILTESSDCAAFTVGGTVPQVVVAPGTIAELSEVMGVAHDAGAVVMPWGGGTQQSFGRTPERVDLVVRTERLNRVIEYEPQDLTISVESGMTLGALDSLLAQHGQMLPIDAPLPQRATIGGLLATAMDGPRRLGYGTSRDLLIGISVVEATGRVSKAGGMVVKNVSGFDMMKLYLGSLGTLAIIASANFKLIPRPRAAATVWCGFDTPAAAIALADAIHGSQLTPAAVEYVSQTPQAGDRRQETGDRRQEADSLVSYLLSPVCNLAICAEGVPAAVERHVRDVTRMAQEVGAASVEVVRGEEHTVLWEHINDLAQTAEIATDELVIRLSCLPSEMGPALLAVEALRDDDDLTLLIDARALSGVAYLRLRCNDTDRLAAAYDVLATSLGPVAPSARIVVVGGLPAIIMHLPQQNGVLAGADVMRRIKEEFDPQGILNRGRMTGIDT